MKVPSDIEIAQSAKLRPIVDIAEKLGIGEEDLELYGRYKAKVSPAVWERVKNNPDGKLILVTAITPTPAGEGKTTTTVGLSQALAKLGQKVSFAIREPSLGPSFGVKGGAAGGGYSQVIPMEDINLHFTGDLHAITTAHNLIAAMIDNSLQQGNELNLDPRRIVWRRVMDLNERALRSVILGLGGKANGVPRESGFDITVASEIMAILCLSTDLMDLKERIRKIVIGYTYDGKAVTAGDIGAAGSAAVLLKDAVKPNLVQTLEGVPAFIHGGPFANIAHGCNSVIATSTALKLGEYVVTEAGFGADLGAEKFVDIKCRLSGLRPDVAVVVATVRALKYHGGVAVGDLEREDLAAVERGMVNLRRHLHNIREVWGIPCVVAVNRFPSDTDLEMKTVVDLVAAEGAVAVPATHFADGGAGAEALATAVLETIEATTEDKFSFVYPDEMPLADKAEAVATWVYGASGVTYTDQAEKGPRPDPRSRQGRPAGLHGQNPVFPLRRPGPPRPPGRFHGDRAGSPAVGRRRVPRRHYGIGDDHAGAAEKAGCPYHRHRRRGPHYGAL